MKPYEASLKEVNGTPSGTSALKGLLYRRIAVPVVKLLRMGATPERLAWSLAAGLLIGINPLFGSATILCLAAAMLFRLNVAASQLGNYLVYPLQIALLIPFLQLGSKVFHTAPAPLSPATLRAAARAHPTSLLRQIWLWEWHALIVWAAIATILVPLIAFTLRPMLRLMLARIKSRDEIELPQSQ